MATRQITKESRAVMAARLRDDEGKSIDEIMKILGVTNRETVLSYVSRGRNYEAFKVQQRTYSTRYYEKVHGPRRMTERGVWTRALVAALIKYWNEDKLSAGMIELKPEFLAVGLTRNAIIGKIHRLRIFQHIEMESREPGGCHPNPALTTVTPRGLNHFATDPARNANHVSKRKHTPEEKASERQRKINNMMLIYNTQREVRS